MILVVAFFIVAATVPLSGGRLSALADLRLRWVPAVVAALLAQIVIINVIPHVLPPALLAALHLLTYAPAVAFVVRNRAVRGLVPIGVGGSMNLAAIAANRGVMPSLPSAAAAAGQDAAAHFVNSSPAAGAPLWFFGDIFAWPQPLPLANVFSIGDVLLVAGAAITLHHVCRGMAATAAATAAPAGRATERLAGKSTLLRG